MHHFPDSVSSLDKEWILLANVGDEVAPITVKIGGATVEAFSLDPDELEVRVYSGIQNGPVEVIGPADGNLIMSRRTLWGPQADFTEMLPF